MSRGTVIALIVAGCVLLAVANVSLWAALNVFEPGRFGQHVAEGLQSPAATEALAGPIVERLLTAFPDIPPLIRTPAELAVSEALQQPIFTPVFAKTAAVANKVMTTSTEDVVGIDLAEVMTNVGSTITGAIAAVAPEMSDRAQTAIDQAVSTSEDGGRLAIYESGRFPKLRTLSNLAPWLALLSGIAALALLVWVALRALDVHRARLYVGAGVMITAILVYVLLAPVAQGFAQQGTTSPAMQVVVGAIVSALVRSFAVQSVILFLIGLGVVVVNHFVAAPDGSTAGSPAEISGAKS